MSNLVKQFVVFSVDLTKKRKNKKEVTYSCVHGLIIVGMPFDVSHEDKDPVKDRRNDVLRDQGLDFLSGLFLAIRGSNASNITAERI